MKKLFTLFAILALFFVAAAVANDDDENSEYRGRHGAPSDYIDSETGAIGHCRSAFVQGSTQFHEYCANVVVNGISVECRQFWMRKAMEVQFNGSLTLSGGVNYMCPTSFFGALAVDHSKNGTKVDSQGNNCGLLIGQSSGKRGSLDDPTNHAENNVTRVIADKNRGNGRNRNFWNKLTQYTTGESCPGCASSQVFAGYKEIVYSTAIDTFLDYGDGQVDIASKTIYSKAKGFPDPQLLVSIRGVLASDVTQHFAWRLQSFQSPQPDFVCPSPCSKQLINGAYTCRMPSLVTFDCPQGFTAITVGTQKMCLVQ